MGNTCRTIAGSFALAIWLLVFLSNSFVARANTIHSVKAAISAKANPAETQEHASQPVLLPEDAGTSLEKKDDSGSNGKKSLFSTCLIQPTAIEQESGIQTTRSFHYHLAIQQRIAIPLFILQHSWKTHLS